MGDTYYVISSDSGVLRENEEYGKWTYHPYSDPGHRRFPTREAAISAIGQLPRGEQGTCRVFGSDNFYDSVYHVPGGNTVADMVTFDDDVVTRRAEELLRRFTDLADEIEYHAVDGEGTNREDRVRRAREALYTKFSLIYAREKR